MHFIHWNTSYIFYAIYILSSNYIQITLISYYINVIVCQLDVLIEWHIFKESCKSMKPFSIFTYSISPNMSTLQFFLKNSFSSFYINKSHMCCAMNISCPPLITHFLRKWRISCPFPPINLLEHEDNFVTTFNVYIMTFSHFFLIGHLDSFYILPLSKV